MNKKAQALLELTLFVSLMLMVLLAALSYQRNLREQKLTDENVFEQTVHRAYWNEFIEKDPEGNEYLCRGGIVTYSLNADRQANRLFQGGQRRTTASSAAIYFSNSEDPPDLEFNYYNNKDISNSTPSLVQKRYRDRVGGIADPEDDTKITTREAIIVAFPMLAGRIPGIVGWFWSPAGDWWKKWGGPIDVVIRTASYWMLYNDLHAAWDKMTAAENRIAVLKSQDEQMGEWGWRVCDKIHDDEALAGIKYVKEITPQVYDIELDENKTLDYDETQVVNPTSTTSTRTAGVGHWVKYKVFRRYDVTEPDPTIPLAPDATIPGATGHIFEYLDPNPIEFTEYLGGTQSETWN